MNDEGAPPDRPAKRSLTIRGHRTSVTLESAFLDALREIAAGEARSLAALVAEIDAERDPATNLASALRLHVLAHYRARAGGGLAGREATARPGGSGAPAAE